jgi:hypothetical protein
MIDSQYRTTLKCSLLWLNNDANGDVKSAIHERTLHTVTHARTFPHAECLAECRTAHQTAHSNGPTRAIFSASRALSQTSNWASNRALNGSPCAHLAVFCLRSKKRLVCEDKYSAETKIYGVLHCFNLQAYYFVVRI